MKTMQSKPANALNPVSAQVAESPLARNSKQTKQKQSKFNKKEPSSIAAKLAISDVFEADSTLAQNFEILLAQNSSTLSDASITDSPELLARFTTHWKISKNSYPQTNKGGWTFERYFIDKTISTICWGN